jgi:hypothetical protein
MNKYGVNILSKSPCASTATKLSGSYWPVKQDTVAEVQDTWIWEIHTYIKRRTKKQSKHDFIFYVKQLHVSAIHSYHQAKHKTFHTSILTSWSRFLLEKLTGLQLVGKFLAFYGTRRFTAAFTSARHLTLPWASSFLSIPPHPTSWRSILILFSNLRLGLPTGQFPSGFYAKIIYF